MVTYYQYTHECKRYLTEFNVIQLDLKPYEETSIFYFSSPHDTSFSNKLSKRARFVLHKDEFDLEPINIWAQNVDETKLKYREEFLYYLTFNVGHFHKCQTEKKSSEYWAWARDLIRVYRTLPRGTQIIQTEEHARKFS